MDKALPTQPMPASQLLARRRTHFSFSPDAENRAAIATVLGLIELPRLHFEGEITPEGRDLLTRGPTHRTGDQACVVTLAPVPARVAEHLTRRYLADWHEPEGEEAEIPEDDTIEPLPHAIDIAAVAIEALALALPDYPARPGHGLRCRTTPPRKTTPKSRKPLAGLADLLARKPEEP